MGPAWGSVAFSVISQVVLMVVVPVFGMWVYNRRVAKRVAAGAAQTTPHPIGCTPSTGRGIAGVFADWRLKKTSWRVIGWAFILGALVFVFNIYVGSFFHGMLDWTGYKLLGPSPNIFTGVTGLLISIMLIGVLPGFCEEVTNRGLLMRGMERRIGIMRAMLFSSIMFGLFHLNIEQVFYTAILGYIVALAVIATRSLWTGIIMHFMNNAVGVYLSFASRNGWFGGNAYNLISNSMANIFIMFLFFFVVYIAMMKIIEKFARENYIKDNAGVAVPVGLKGWTATRFYITGREKRKGEGIFPRGLTPLELSLLCGILFLGLTITVFTFVWGML
jgi:membrane protease YdiL (CAAX protease family)